MPCPNILLVITHDTGQHLHCYGHASVRTPNLDRLAAEGVRFDHYYCTAPQCSPSRGSIITGRFPHVNGLMGLVNRGWNLPNSEATIPLLLREAGYETRLFGFQHEKRDARDLGCCYNWISRRGERPTVANIGPQVEAFLRERGSAPADAPFFAMVGFSETHRPFDGYGAAEPASVALPAYLPDDPDVRRDLAQFEGCVAAMDAGVGGILTALAESGLAEETLVIYTTDHGIAFPRAKCNLYDAGIETALLMRWPGGFAGGRVELALLSNVDLLPTLLEVAGAPPPANLDGRTFLGLLTGGEYQPRAEIFAEKTWHDKYDPMRAVRTERFKYIRSYDPHRLVDLPLDIQNSISGAAVRDLWPDARPPEMLFDLDADPLERRNLADDPAFAAVRADLAARMDAWQARTRDPILDGPVPPPRPAAQLRGCLEPPSPAAMEAVCRSLAQRQLETLNSDAPEALAEDYAEDCALLFADGVVRGREALRRFWGERLAPRLAGRVFAWEALQFDGEVFFGEWRFTDPRGATVLTGVSAFTVGSDGLISKEAVSLRWAAG